MRTRVQAGLLALLFLVPACAGSAAREEVLAPVAVRLLNNVLPDLERGLDEGVAAGALTAQAAADLRGEVDELRADIEAGEPGLLASWANLEPWALVGIAARVTAGEIGPGVAESLTERVNQLRRVLGKLES